MGGRRFHGWTTDQLTPAPGQGEGPGEGLGLATVQPAQLEVGALSRLLGLHARGFEPVAISGRDGDVAREAVLGVAVGQLGFPADHAFGFAVDGARSAGIRPGCAAPRRPRPRPGRPGPPERPASAGTGAMTTDTVRRPSQRSERRQEVGVDLDPGPLGDPVGGVPGAVGPVGGPGLVGGHRPPAHPVATPSRDPVGRVGGTDQRPEISQAKGRSGLKISVAELTPEQANLATQLVQGSLRRAPGARGAADGQHQPGGVGLGDETFIGDQLPVALTGQLPPSMRRHRQQLLRSRRERPAVAPIAAPVAHGDRGAAVEPLEAAKWRIRPGEGAKNRPPRLQLTDLSVAIEQDK